MKVTSRHAVVGVCVRGVVALFALGAVFFSARAQVVLNEVMFDPAGSEYYDEFVELLNLSSDTLDLTGWQIGDDVELDQIVDAGAGLLLGPGQFALVLDPGYFEHSTSYDSLIPESALLVTIADGAFGKGGFSNSDPETVYLVDATGDTVAAYRYTLGNSPGFSDEKIDPKGGDAAANWANSRVYLGTPGFANSVARKEVDLALHVEGPETLTMPDPGEIQLRAVVRNVGRRATEDGTVRFWWDRNDNGKPERTEIVSESPLPGVARADSVRVTCLWIPPGRGFFRLLAECFLDADEAGSNDRDTVSVIVRCSPGQLKINEIYYRPAVGEPEWVELYNADSDSVSLAGFWLSDGTRRGTVCLGLSAAERLLAPGCYAVVSEGRGFFGFAGLDSGAVLVPETGFPSLNNSGDEVIVRDVLGTTLDSVRYRASWGGENGVSLERISPYQRSNTAANWGSCVAMGGSTPGKKNSISPADRSLSLRLKVEPGTCTRRDQPVSVSCTIRNEGLRSVNLADAELLAIGPCQAARDTVRLKQIVLPILAPSDTFVVGMKWVPSKAGRWQILARVYPGEDTLVVHPALAELWVEPEPASVVVNEIQYDPPAGQSEWVEVYNVGPDGLSLNNWWFGDERRRVMLDSLECCFEAGGYGLILPRGAAPPAGAPSGVPVWHVRGSWPGLSNSGDAVVLVDPCGELIDSVFYWPSWRQSTGSLERILAEASSTDSANWRSSSDPFGATPGRLNTATPREVDLEVGRIEARNPRVAQLCSLRVLVVNVGRAKVSSASLTLSLVDDGRRSLTVLDMPALSPGDSMDVAVPVVFEQPGWVSLLVQLVSAGDMRPENDTSTVRLYVSAPFGALALNEIYVATLPNQSEWVEIANNSPWDVCLRSWTLQDARGAKGSGTVTDSVVVQPGELALLAADSSVAVDWGLAPDAKLVVLRRWPGFNDDGDLLCFVDPAGRSVDSLRYLASWGIEQGYSLEKLRPELSSATKANWTRSTAPEGGTPAKPNSVYAYTLPSKAALSVNPNPFSPDGDGHEDVAIFSLSFPDQVATVRLRIFDVAGRRVRQLLANEPCGPHRLVVWDGLDDFGHPCRVGPYVALLEWRTAGGRIGTERVVVVLAW